MSNSGEQPNPYAQQPPQPPQGAAPQGPPPPPQMPQQNQGPQPPSPYGQVPQQNPYAQQPAGYGYPAAHGVPTMPGGVPAGAPGGYGGGPAPTGGGKGLPAWLWAVGGAVVASAVWAGVLFATGGSSDAASPDLGGYRYQADLCGSTSWTPFEDARYKMEDSSTSASAGENPASSGHQDPALDSMWCNADLVPDDAGDDDYSSTFVYTKAFLHKKTDPAPEFAAQYRSYEEQESSTKYKVTPVQGIGDEAYLVTREESADSKSRYVVLGVRDGWMTYETSWSSFSSSDNSGAPSSDEVADMLRTSATQTLKKLQG
ncbi:hypothetical protein C3486_19955 [Streptomyces sp. Ru73]|uniref:hypothetical protein n=1 Tax=Streptomyces sp. Ru73 TaxID=2080748 RepID=UPI000CDCE838|nr:hypothetical protein [Streptomyces sp. Ru73]POX39050.1 hypothetical protein C3486_19955 [Streptomyces sp. Ru73]